MSDTTAPIPEDYSALRQALADPFEMDEVKFKPQTVKGNRALVVAYVDARVIQDRLDDVLGVDGWQDECTPLDDGSVMCRLQLRFGNTWIVKCDVGSPSEQPDGGDRLKAAFSDAFKRAAVKFGLARYLYRLEPMWVDYDPVKKKLLSKPNLPPDAQPRRTPKPALAPTPRPAPAPAPVVVEAPKPAEAKPNGMPANGRELRQRLERFDATLAAKGLATAGELLTHVQRAVEQAGFGTEWAKWSGPAIELAVNEAKAFDAAHRKAAKEPQAA
jgi:hypothetical protein